MNDGGVFERPCFVFPFVDDIVQAAFRKSTEFCVVVDFDLQIECLVHQRFTRRVDDAEFRGCLSERRNVQIHDE